MSQPAMINSPAYPTAGDAIRNTGGFWGADAGAIAILDGIVGEERDGYTACFHYSAFRGPLGGRDFTDEVVSCSGGPAPWVEPQDLKPTGETVTVTFWKWKTIPRADGGEDYTLDVPLWDWTPPEKHR